MSDDELRQAVATACRHALAVLMWTREEDIEACMNAVFAAEQWVDAPSNENRDKARQASEPAWAAARAADAAATGSVECLRRPDNVKTADVATSASALAAFEAAVACAYAASAVHDPSCSMMAVRAAKRASFHFSCVNHAKRIAAQIRKGKPWPTP